MAEFGADTDVTDAVPEVAGSGTARVTLSLRPPSSSATGAPRCAIRVAGLDKPIGFSMSSSQYQYWKHTHLTVEVVKGRGSGFSVEAPEGVRCIIRSRLFSDDELRDLGDR